jgi:UPF0271 protein
MWVDLNADVGEECGDDAALIPLLTSANVACGAHAGDAAVMRRTVELCLRRGVRIGAHVSYPDREHFGRRNMSLPPADIKAYALDQLEALAAVARAAGARVTYLKAHGALYNRMADDAVVADAVLGALTAFDPNLKLLTLPGSAAMDRAWSAGIEAVGEAFADRGYRDDARLQPRSETNAVISDAGRVVARGLRLVREGVIESVSGKAIPVEARSLCVHGDTPGAVELARALRAALEGAGVELRAFT